MMAFFSYIFLCSFAIFVVICGCIAFIQCVLYSINTRNIDSVSIILNNIETAEYTLRQQLKRFPYSTIYVIARPGTEKILSLFALSNKRITALWGLQ